MTHKKMFQFLTLSLFVALVVVAPLQAADGCQEKAPCEKKMKAEGCEKVKAEDFKKMKAEGCMMFKQIPNLSDEQKGKLEKLHGEHQKMMAAAMAEMQKKCQVHREAVRALLTAEQKVKFDEMKDCGHMQGQGGMMKHAHKGCMHGGKHLEGQGCQEKGKQDKHECQKQAAEDKK
ncbi:MAG: hypothetical protein JXI33_07700 [Candidatus Aminicenantes bacterium]|nr:hypothetical protein [Candidatus Aminicenantes bacterium]